MECDFLGAELIKLAVLMRREIDNYLGSYGISAIQSHILTFIDEQNGDVYQKDIEDRFGIRRSSVSSVMLTMEKNGLIERKSGCGDARLKSIHLTPKGKEINDTIKSVIKSVDMEMKKELGERKQDFLDSIHILQSYLNNKEGNVCD